MEGQIGDEAAIRFAQVFYQQIFLRSSLVDAFKIATSTLSDTQRSIPTFHSDEPDHILLDDAVRITQGSISTNKNPIETPSTPSTATPAPASMASTDDDIWYELGGHKALVTAVGYNSGGMLAKFPELRPHKLIYNGFGAAYDAIGARMTEDLMNARVSIPDFVKRLNTIVPMRSLAFELSKTYKVPLN